MVAQPIRQGTVYHGEDRETWTVWYHFPRLRTAEEVEDVLSFHGIERQSGRPGEVFLCTPRIEHSENYTKISQYGGLDI